jgi:hypothetical protein
MSAAFRPIAIRPRLEVGLEDGLQDQLEGPLDHEVGSCTYAVRIIATDLSQAVCVMPTNWLSVLTSGFQALLQAAFTCLWTHLTYVISSSSCPIASYSA